MEKILDKVDNINTLTNIVIVFITLVMMFSIGRYFGIRINQDEAIKAGVAYYNPTNAVFTWKTNLVDINK